MMPPNIKRLLQEMAIFSKLPEKEIEHLSHQVRIRNIARDEILVQLGEHLEGFFVVVSGAVTLTVISPRGDGRIIEIVDAGQSFGEALLFLDKASPVQARATRAGKVMFIPGKEVLNLVTSTPEFALSMLADLSIRMHKLVTDIQSCSLHRAQQRVVGYLLGELENHDSQGDNMMIELPVSKKLVASKLDLTAETFSRVLHELAEQNEVIRVDGKKIDILSIANLRRCMVTYQ